MKKTLLLLIFLSVFFSVEAQKKVQKKQPPTKTSAVKKKPLTKPVKETIKAKIASPKAVTSTVTKPTNISGQWRGYFDDNGNISLYNEASTEYVLELNISGKKISGYSYSYFQGRKFFVICSLSGTYDADTKSLEVTETRRIKGNTPSMDDCLQKHILAYKKVNGKEELVGTWEPSPGYACGKGITTLSRKNISTLASNSKKPTSRSLFSEPKVHSKLPKNAATSKETEPTVLNITKSKTASPVVKPAEKNAPIEKEPSNINAPVKAKGTPEATPDISFTKRDNYVLKTIEVDNPTFKVEMYDNGDVDGDSVSLFYNGKLLLSHKRLSTKPITLNLSIDDKDSVNELIMYAENLGEIPPNTALMIVTDGDNRYEVRITSDLQKSGLIRFIRKQK